MTISSPTRINTPTGPETSIPIKQLKDSILPQMIRLGGANILIQDMMLFSKAQTLNLSVYRTNHPSRSSSPNYTLIGQRFSQKITSGGCCVFSATPVRYDLNENLRCVLYNKTKTNEVLERRYTGNTLTIPEQTKQNYTYSILKGIPTKCDVLGKMVYAVNCDVEIHNKLLQRGAFIINNIAQASIIVVQHDDIEVFERDCPDKRIISHENI